jgi:AraC-like DNA-binding protein
MTPVEKRLTSLLNSLATRVGIHAAAVEGVTLLRAEESYPRVPVLYEPSIVIVGQGRKRGFLGDQMYVYDAHNYLVLSVPLPFECETEASPEKPMLAVSIRVDLGVLAELLMRMDQPANAELMPQGIYSTKLDTKLTETVVRLLECLSDPVEARILGPPIIREITYRVLRGEQGGALRAAAAMHSRFGQVNRALQRIHTEYDRDWSVEALAEKAGMSPSAFHQNFKAVTSTSPLQYLKTIRLHKARLLMVHEGVRAGVAAERVGYESQSQFSREFKRLFGASPVEEADRHRRVAGLAQAS